jgi:hypothetical protein
VGDTPGEGPDRFQLLGLEELRLQLFTLCLSTLTRGDIDDGGLGGGLPLPIHQSGQGLHPDRRAVFSDSLKFIGVWGIPPAAEPRDIDASEHPPGGQTAL